MIDWKSEIAKLEGWSFGDNAQMADELAQETAQGRNLANCSLWSKDKAMPKAGDRSYVKDSKGNPVCVIEVTSVQKLPFKDVDESFAFAEGYKSLQEWRNIHIDFFSRRSSEFNEQSIVVCQRFKLLHVF